MKQKTKVCTCRPYLAIRAKMTQRFLENGKWIDDNQAAAILAGEPMPPPDKELLELIGTVFCVIAGEDVELKRNKPTCKTCGLPVPIDPEKAAFPCMVAGTEYQLAEILREMDVIPEDTHLLEFIEQAQAQNNVIPLMN